MPVAVPSVAERARISGGLHLARYPLERMIVVWFALAMLLMLAGVIASLLPLVPGLALVLVGVYVYALETGLAAGVGLGHLVLYTIVGGAAIVASSLAAPLATRAAGGSRAGVIGATLGLILGFLLAGPVGLVAGPCLGAVGGELLVGHSARQSIRSGFGTAVGILAGKVTEVAVSVGLVASFVMSVVASGALRGHS